MRVVCHVCPLRTDYWLHMGGRHFDAVQHKPLSMQTRPINHAPSTGGVSLTARWPGPCSSTCAQEVFGKLGKFMFEKSHTQDPKVWSPCTLAFIQQASHGQLPRGYSSDHCAATQLPARSSCTLKIHAPQYAFMPSMQAGRG